jgi:IstB-like ATP binding protein
MREHLRDRKPVGSRLPASVLIGQFAHEPAQALRRRGKHLDARQGHVSSYNPFALIDRLTHHAEIITIEGESYRKREAEQAQKRKHEQKAKP